MTTSTVKSMISIFWGNIFCCSFTAVHGFLGGFCCLHCSALKKVVTDQQNNWDLILEATRFSLRSKLHTTTKCSPFLLMYVSQRNSLPFRDCSRLAAECLVHTHDLGCKSQRSLPSKHEETGKKSGKDGARFLWPIYNQLCLWKTSHPEEFRRNKF